MSTVLFDQVDEDNNLFDRTFFLGSTVTNMIDTIPFLDASSHLYKRVCPSVRPLVRPSVRLSVRPSVRYAFSKIAKINEIRHKKRVHLNQGTTTTFPMKPLLTQLPPPPLTRLP